MSDYTPAPWTIDDTQKYYPKSCIRHRGVIICHLPTLADSRGAARLEDEANARLIAAAPKLLEACRAVILWAATDRVRHVLGSNYDNAFGPVRAAIAKAETPHPASCGCELCRLERAADQAVVEIPY